MGGSSGKPKEPQEGVGSPRQSYGAQPLAQAAGGPAVMRTADINFRDFDGDADSQPIMFAVLDPLIRTESVDVNNDPRIMSDSVIAHRLNGFASVVVASMLLCSLAFSAILVLAPSDGARGFSLLKLIALIGMLLTVCMNLFCTVVVIQQMYLINRIATSGAMGFEMAKSLYLSKTYVMIRHVGISMFYRSIPLFVLTLAILVWEEVCPETGGRAPISAIIICSGMGIVMFTMLYVHYIQRTVFHEKLMKMQAFEKPIRQHMDFDLTGHLSRHGASLLRAD